MKRFSLIVALVIAFSGLLIYPTAVLAVPRVGAGAYGVYDLETGQFLGGKNWRNPMPPASTTKIMTALLAEEYLDLEETALVSERAARTEPTTIGLKAGQQMRVRDLLTAALLSSANDATVVLAERIAGSEELFAHLMNKKAFVLGAVSTTFKNSNGLPAEGHLSTCHDLFLISRAALQKPFFAETVAMTEAYIDHPGYPQGKLVKNTNHLLTTYPGARGVKTGTTDSAGKCLVGLAERKGRQLVTVVLRAGDRYSATRALLDYGFEDLSPTRVIDKDKPFKYLRVDEGDAAKVAVCPERDSVIWLPEDGLKEVEKKVLLDYRPRAPVNKGERIGIIRLYYQGELVDEVGLHAASQVERIPSGVWRIIKRAMDDKRTTPKSGDVSGSCCGI
ncbi:MAG: D-alanyl-D-alanine carboxypeptidase [Syntrophomonadaceae bacterium]|nr:D-alanyl-D-alanine carboxypeptidase [Syntrophomonadaceae bacterium]